MNARSHSQGPTTPPPTHPGGTALVVAGAEAETSLVRELQRAGFGTVFATDAYAAMVELARRPLAFRALVVSLVAIYPEELNLIRAVRERFGHVEVILADVRGRSATLSQAMDMGAQSVLESGRLHRLGSLGGPSEASSRASAESDAEGPQGVLSSDELRALLEGA